MSLFSLFSGCDLWVLVLRAPVNPSISSISSRALRKTCLAGILLVSKQNYEEAVPFLYKSCTSLTLNTPTVISTLALSRERPREVSPENLESTAQAPVTAPTSGAPAAAEGIPSSPSQATLNRKVQDLVSQYHLDQKLLERQLYACRHYMPRPADGFVGLFNHETHGKNSWRISLKNYPRVFEMVSRFPGYEDDMQQMVQTLRSAISGREEAQKLYQSFDALDSGHENTIRVLKAGETILLNEMASGKVGRRRSIRCMENNVPGWTGPLDGQ